MPERKWTKSQRDAMEAKGGPILVSAAAGSGKTAVLVERAVRLICDEQNPVDADKLLLVTFSNAAAAEMKQRIAARLSELAGKNPEQPRLKRQIMLLSGAQISTIHAFCLELIRQNFQNLDITPDFSLADESEMAIFKQECVRDTAEAFYEGERGAEFLELVELISSRRDDARLMDTILKIYEFSRSHPFFEDWLSETLSRYDSGLPVGQTVWGQSILRHAADSLRFCVRALRCALDAIAGDEKLEKAYGGPIASDLTQAEHCLTLVEAGNWDAAADALRRFDFAGLGRVSGNDSQKVRAKGARDASKEIIRGLADRYFNATESEFAGDIADLRPKIAILFDAVRDFSMRLDAMKRAKKRLDFSDLEHLALSLLVERRPDGSMKPNARAGEIAARFACVLVDEYQDTNEVQEAIFTSVSRGGNLFMVGDVKQSIYSFRQAMPEIFMRKKEAFARYNGERYPAKIILDSNFRSRRSVTEAVNYLFSELMSKEMGEIDYGEEERLVCGAIYPDAAGMEPELMLLSTKEYGGGRDAEALEAEMVGKRIRDMIAAGFRVEDKGRARPAQPRDFCVLMRSPRGRSDIYVKELSRLGIPAWADNAGGFLALREVSAVVSLLRALDNPLLDISLVAAMEAPWEHFTDDDIARIRLGGPSAPFFTALRKAEEEGDGKAADFLRRFDELRRLSALLPTDRLLLRLYEMTGALLCVQAMPMGEGRKANLLLLMEYAGTYHGLGYKKLSGFVGFLNRLEEKGGDLAPANALSDSANVVRIVSIHRSKGLEYPVVFLCDTARRFNKTDLRSNTLLHTKYGFACFRRNERTMSQYPTVPMQAIRLESERSLLSEELRILYVALTRAREKLIVTAAVKSELQKKLAGLCVSAQGGRISPHAMSGASGYVDWLLMALLRHPDGDGLREIAQSDEVGRGTDANRWIISIHTPPEESETAAREEQKRTAEPDRALAEELRRRIDFQYPYWQDTKIPTKLAVSAAAKGKKELAGYRFASRPKFLGSEALTAAEKGNAIHKFMQFADYERARDDLDGEIERMRDRRFLTYAEASSLRKPALRKFFTGKLATRIFTGETVYRELRFMQECGPEMLGDAVEDMRPGSQLVLQGVADCVFVEDGQAVIVDYKSDRVAAPDELRERYGKQLEYYAAILSRSLGMPVKECILYSFALGQAVPV